MSAPLVGYRAWRLVGDTLVSLFNATEWPVGERLIAECKPGTVYAIPRHPAPYVHCGCGIYARTTLTGIFEELWARGIGSALDMAVGAVLLYGATYHAKAGPHVIRAEFCQPLCLMADDAWYPFRPYDEKDMDTQGRSASMAQVSQRYGLPLIPRSVIEQYAAEYGEQIGAPDHAAMAAEPRWRAWWPWGRD